MSPPRDPFDLRPRAAEPSDEGDGAPVAPRPRGATRLVPRPESADGAAADGAAEAGPVKRPVRVARGINALLVAVCLLGSLHVAGLIVVEARRLAYTEGEIQRLEGEIDALVRETADLRAVAERADDERYRELLARRQGYVYADETRFIGPPSR